jgi:hypothetical protein
MDSAAPQKETILAEALKPPGTVLDWFIFLYRRIYEDLIVNQNLLFGPQHGTPDYHIEQYHRHNF